jgi:hypothetical protein
MNLGQNWRKRSSGVAQFQSIKRKLYTPWGVGGGGGGSPAGAGWLEWKLLFHGALLEKNNLQNSGVSK